MVRTHLILDNIRTLNSWIEECSLMKVRRWKIIEYVLRHPENVHIIILC